MSTNDISLITLHNAIVRRNGKDILSVDDFDLKQGESIALIGPNGAGKSTFVKLLTGMLSPSEGTLLLNGKPTEELHPESRFDAQSVVVQDPTHYETFTLYENVFLGETHRPYEEKTRACPCFFRAFGSGK